MLIAKMDMEVLGKKLPTVQKVIIETKEKKFVYEIPRYLPWTGWIEIFFLNPQEEWVELTGVERFYGEGNGKIPNGEMKEKVYIKRFEKYRIIGIQRAINNKIYSGYLIEDWIEWNEKRKINTFYINLWNKEKYEMEMEKRLIEKDELKPALKEIYEPLENKYKDLEKQIWVKKFKVEGEKPEWKDIPIEDGKTGKIIEFGFLVENYHGNWYKIIEYENGIKYFIREYGFKSDIFIMDGKKVRGKREYHKELYKIKDTKDIMDILKDLGEIL